MPIRYTGAGPYCYSNSLSMCLEASGCDEAGIRDPGFLECLTTMPFGKQYRRAAHGTIGTFYPDGSDPDTGLTRALDALGWDCEDTAGGDAESALARLRRAVAGGPALLGPLEMGFLGYNPAVRNSPIGDHFIVALGMEDETVLVHDPAGYPSAIISWEQFCAAWRADGIAYRRGPYTMRHDFRRVRAETRPAMVRRAIPLVRQNVMRRSDQATLRGAEAVREFARELRGEVSERVRSHLIWFALPLGARRCLDGAAFLAEAGLPELAANYELQSRTFGRMQSDGVVRRWGAVADAMAMLGDLEERFTAGLRAI